MITLKTRSGYFTIAEPQHRMYLNLDKKYHYILHNNAEPQH